MSSSSRLLAALLLAVTGPVFAEEAAAPTAKLQKLEAAEGFTVMLPGAAPDPIRQKVTIPAGDVKTAAWSVQDASAGALFSISTADYPEKVVAARPASDFLNEGRDGLVTQLKGTLKDEKDLQLQGYPGKSYTVISEMGEVRARIFLVGPRLYTMLVLYASGSIPAHAEQFLTSLVLIDPPPVIKRAPKTTPKKVTPAAAEGAARDGKREPIR